MKRRVCKRLTTTRACLGAFAVASSSGFAQDTAYIESLRAMSLEQLLNLEVSIASIDARPIREQPGIVSVVSRAEIRERGARDLAEILQLVPGFGLGVDVQSVVGPTFRGLWAYEGKTQLIVDGIELNEDLYGTIQLGSHVPAEQIEQVAIIRGPGSARYGGTAELAVIRVTTRGAKMNGGYATYTPEVADGRFAQTFNAGVGYELEDWRLSLTTYQSENFRSNQDYVGLDGNTLDLTGVSDVNPWNINLGVGWKDLNLRVIYDAYRYEDQVNYGEILPESNELEFNSILVQGDYALRPAEWLELTPTVTFRHQTPWQLTGPAGGFDIEVERIAFDLPVVSAPTDNSKLLAGVRYQHDAANAKDASFYGEDADTYFDGSDQVGYDTWSGYAQYDLDTQWVNFSIGGRYEDHSTVGGKFVPRAALTKAWEQFHLKALFDQAYRTPNIGVIADALTAEIEPETTTTYELEAGYQFTESLSLVGNLFYLQIEDPIIYSAVSDGYFNDAQVSSFGAEAEFRITRERWNGYLGYSWYAAEYNMVGIYRSGDETRLLGTPAHKLAFSATAHLTERLAWNWNGALLSPRAAYQYPATAPVDLDPEFQLHTYIEYRWRQFQLGAGIANLLDEELLVPQPYDGGLAPLPAKRRQFFVKVGYEF